MNYTSKMFFVLILLTGCLPVLEAQRVITLEQAIEEAHQKSPTIRQAGLSLEQSRENLVAQRAALKSKFALNLTPISYSRGRNYNESLGNWITTETTSSSGTFSVTQPIVATDGTISLINNLGWQDSNTSYGSSNSKGFNNNLSLKLDQPLFTHNQTKMDLKQLEYTLENSQLNYALKILSVELSVTTAFYEVHEAQQNVGITKEEYENYKKSYEIIKNKVEAGLSAKEELYQAELDLLSSQSDLYNEEVSLQNSLDSFKQLLGISLDEDIVILAEVNVTPVEVELKGAIEHGLSSRMEIRQREIEIEEGLFDIITTRALNEFEGNIGVTVGIAGENSELSRVYDTPTNSNDISVSLSVPIYDWGEKKARLRAVKAAQTAREFNLEDERIEISLSIRQVCRNLTNLLNQIEIARKNEETATLTYDINLEKYKNGDLTSMDLSLVQNQLTQQKQSLTNALIQYKLELLNLKIQTLFDYENNQPVVPDFSQNNKK